MAQAYVKRWAETGRLLDDIRWRELASLDADRALAASDALIDAALRVPLPARRRTWSGLVEQQAVSPFSGGVNRGRPGMWL
jgi:hypothetical protein